jgi:DNA excision repair protein ERCC-4
MIDMSRPARPVVCPTIPILQDSREQRPPQFSAAVSVEIVTLVTGDYSLRGATEMVAIERKSKPDLVQCVGRERPRFIDQMERLAAYPIRALVVEATWDELAAGIYRSRINPRSVTGTLLALTVDLGIPVWLVGTPQNAAEAIERSLCRVWRQHVAKGAA